MSIVNHFPSRNLILKESPEAELKKLGIQEAALDAKLTMPPLPPSFSIRGEMTPVEDQGSQGDPVPHSALLPALSIFIKETFLRHRLPTRPKRHTVIALRVLQLYMPIKFASRQDQLTNRVGPMIQAKPAGLIHQTFLALLATGSTTLGTCTTVREHRCLQAFGIQLAYLLRRGSQSQLLYSGRYSHGERLFL